MCTNIADRTRPSFIATIRWRGPDVAVDLETRHFGFATSEAAGRYATGREDASPRRLYLRPNRVLLCLGVGGEVDFPHDLTTVWLRAGRWGYKPRPFVEIATRPIAWGNYSPAGCGVFSATGQLVVASIPKGCRASDSIELRGIVRAIESSTRGRLTYRGLAYKVMVDEDVQTFSDRDKYAVLPPTAARQVLNDMARGRSVPSELPPLLAQASERLAREFRPPFLSDGLVLLRRNMSPRMVRLVHVPVVACSRAPKPGWD